MSDLPTPAGSIVRVFTGRQGYHFGPYRSRDDALLDTARLNAALSGLLDITPAVSVMPLYNLWELGVITPGYRGIAEDIAALEQLAQAADEERRRAER